MQPATKGKGGAGASLVVELSTAWSFVDRLLTVGSDSSRPPNGGRELSRRHATEWMRLSVGSGTSASGSVTSTALRMRLPCNCMSRVANVVT